MVSVAANPAGSFAGGADKLAAWCPASGVDCEPSDPGWLVGSSLHEPNLAGAQLGGSLRADSAGG